MANPPLPTPKPGYDNAGDVSDAVGRQDTKDLPVTVGVMRKANLFTRILMVIVGGSLGFGSAFGGGWVALSSMRAEAQTVADAGVARAEKASAAASAALEVRVALLEKVALASADADREQKQAVSDVNRKLDVMMERWRIPNPAPGDGGPR